MKNTGVFAALCILILCGCGAKDEDKASITPSAAARHAGKGDKSQRPYFYGLIEEYKTILAEDPNNLAVIIALGNAYFDSGQWKKAITIYEHALLLDPRNADVRTDMGTCFRNMGMPDRAIAEYRQALQMEPGHLNARYNEGIVYAHDKRDYRSAIKIWEELLRIAPNHPHADAMKSGIAEFRKLLRKESK